MEIRIIGPADELGDVHNLTIFGNTVFRDRWTEVDLTPDQVRKVEGNRYFEIRGVKSKDKDPEVQKAAESEEAKAELIRARLTELGVPYHPRAGLAKLESALEVAEKKAAKDKAEADASGQSGADSNSGQ